MLCGFSIIRLLKLVKKFSILAREVSCTALKYFVTVIVILLRGTGGEIMFLIKKKIFAAKKLCVDQALRFVNILRSSVENPY